MTVAERITLHPAVKNTHGYAYLAERFDGESDELEALIAALCAVAIKHADDEVLPVTVTFGDGSEATVDNLWPESAR